jgi:cytochrome c-type biogenesis protein CcmH/NrfG
MFSIMEVVAVNLSSREIIDAVKNLSVKEKQKINDILWEGDFPIPEEHKRILKDRQKKIAANPQRLKDWDIVSKTL